MREKLREYQNHRACPSCGGARLRKEARYVYVSGEPLHEVSAWPLTKTRQFFETLDLDGNKNKSPKKSSKKSPAARINVGLDYTEFKPLRRNPLRRRSPAHPPRQPNRQRFNRRDVRFGRTSIGLHQRDNDRLLATLKRLRDLGNSVIVVEHDEDAIREADFVVDMGPARGRTRRQRTDCRHARNVAKCEKSVTGQYLSGKNPLPCRLNARPSIPTECSSSKARAATTSKTLPSNCRSV